jgi:hypothetical protein
MGTINHHAVIATTWDEELFQLTKLACHNLTGTFTFGPPTINGYQTVILVPDGSKEGWADSDAGDTARAKFIEHLQTSDYDDGSSPWEWIEVSFGEYGEHIVSGNNENLFEAKP